MRESRKNLIERIAEKHSLNLHSFKPLTGGDINEVYKLECKDQTLVLKLNSALKFPGMFEAEKKGLELLAAPCVIQIPKIFDTAILDDHSYLLLEYIPTGTKNRDFWQVFGNQLAQLHSVQNDQFGLDHDNYLGSLPQKNSYRTDAISFYTEMRLEPQLKLAREKGYDLPDASSLFKNCESIIPKEKASLIHGDLWGGNYLVEANGGPCIIDPAVAYAPREMDIAMTRLFGGFYDQMISSYQDYFALKNDWEQRIELWQLYYLLMHLNVFGTSYRSQVTEIIHKYS